MQTINILNSNIKGKDDGMEKGALGAASYMLDMYSAAMIQHIEFYTVGQYRDFPDDPAAGYSVADCVWQIQRYHRRHGKNARPGQDQVDLLKIGHYAAIAASKIGGLDPGAAPAENALSARSWEWLTVLGWLEMQLEAGGRFRVFDDYLSHIDQLGLMLDKINRRVDGPSIDQMLGLIFHAGLAWSRLPAEETNGLPLVRVRQMHREARLPEVKTAGSAGADLASVEQYVIDPGCVAVIRTGLSLEIPEGYEGQVRARSGLSAKKQLILLNGVGTIDSDYRGEVLVPVKNIGESCQAVQPGDRVAQLVIAPVARSIFDWSMELSETARADGGFGSTGMN